MEFNLADLFECVAARVPEREAVVLSQAYTAIRNAVWLAVRQQVTIPPRGER